MKKVLLLAVMMGIGCSMFAQTDSTKTMAPGDTTFLRFGSLEIIMIGHNDPDTSNVVKIDHDDDRFGKYALTHWGGIDYGINFLLNADMDFEFSDEEEWLDLDLSRSRSWNFNIYEEKIRLAKDYVGIITGFGVNMRTFSFSDSVQVFANADTTSAFFDSSIKRERNKLRTTHIVVPLMLEFNTSLDNHKSFHIAAGVLGGWRVGTIYKQKYDFEGERIKAKSRDDYNVNPFSLDATVRVGYRNWTLFANYALTPLFRDGKAPELYPLTAGIQVLPW